MKTTFEIEKPVSDLNFLTLGIKYIVLFIVLFIASWIAIPILFSRKNAHNINEYFDLIIDNPIIFGLIMATLIISWFIFRILKKYKQGEIYRIIFNDSEQKLEISTVNLINDQEKENKYDYKNLAYEIKNTEDPLFGKQRIIIFKNVFKIVHEINIERTAWCRNEQIEKLFERIKTGHNTV